MDTIDTPSRSRQHPLLLPILALGSIFSLLAPVGANASLTYDVRATGVQGSAQSGDRKTVTSVRPGDIITFQLYAIVAGANQDTTDDGYQFSFFSLISSQLGTNFTGKLSGLDGTLTTPTGVTLNPNFNIGAAARGIPQSLTSDGVQDIGGLLANVVNGWIKPRAAVPDSSLGTPIQPGYGITVGPGAGLEYLLGSVQLFVSGVADPQSSSVLGINVKAPTARLGIQAVGNWKEDGVILTNADLTSVNSIGVSITAAPAVPTPEPTSLLLLASAIPMWLSRRVRR